MWQAVAEWEEREHAVPKSKSKGGHRKCSVRLRLSKLDTWSALESGLVANIDHGNEGKGPS